MLAIDYDNTYTADPITFDQVIRLFQQAGHGVVCITNRTSDMKKQEIMSSIGKLVPVIFAGADWKRDAATKNGYKIDFWLDDNPSSIERQMLIGSHQDG